MKRREFLKLIGFAIALPHLSELKTIDNPAMYSEGSVTGLPWSPYFPHDTLYPNEALE